MDVFYTGAKTCWTPVNINKCGLAGYKWFLLLHACTGGLQANVVHTTTYCIELCIHTRVLSHRTALLMWKLTRGREPSCSGTVQNNRAWCETRPSCLTTSLLVNGQTLWWPDGVVGKSSTTSALKNSSDMIHRAVFFGQKGLGNCPFDSKMSRLVALTPRCALLQKGQS